MNDMTRDIVDTFNGRVVVTIPTSVKPTTKFPGKVRGRITSCTDCELHETRTKACPISGAVGGPPSSGVGRLCVIGEAPGPEEDRHGTPFIGPAGKFLRACLGSAGFGTKTVSYMNTVACYPGRDEEGKIRAPSAEHQRSCWMKVLHQIEVSGARHLLLVGSSAAQMWADLPMMKLAGEIGVWDLGGDVGPRIVMATLHPSFILRSKNKRTLREELVAQLKVYQGVVSDQYAAAGVMGLRCVACPRKWEGQPMGWVKYMDSRGLGWCEQHAAGMANVKTRIPYVQESMFEEEPF